MQILTTTGWSDYALLDSGNGMRLEQFGPYTTVRPDPQAIWQPSLPQSEWLQADVRFVRTSGDKGEWKFKRHLPEKWLMHWHHVSFWTRLTSFKHTGVFPEQSLQWEFIEEKIKERVKKYSSSKRSESRSNFSTSSNNKKTVILNDSEESQSKNNLSIEKDPSTSLRFAQDDKGVSILNLFGYTGIATLVASSAGAKVTHVDASKPSISWAKENQIASKLQDKPIRWILDDAEKFVEREIRRGNTYDAVIMDPPVYGHGPTGQIWKFSENFPRLMQNIKLLLSNDPLFVVVNAYAISSSALMLQNVMSDFLPKGKIEVGELVLEEKTSHRPLSTGIFARWEK